MGTKCIIVTKEIRDMATQLEINPNRVATYVGVWQQRNNTSAMPNINQIKDLVVELRDDKAIEEAAKSLNLSVITGDLGNLAEQRKEIGYTPEEITYRTSAPTISKDAISESIVKLNSLFTPQQIANRTKNVAFLFSTQVDSLYRKKIKELRGKLKTVPATSIDGFAYSQQLKQLEDTKTGRNTFVQEFLNINEVIEEVKKDITKRHATLASKVTDENRESLEYQLDQLYKMTDSIDLLMVQALNDIEANEGIRIVLSQKRDATGKKQLLGHQIEEDTNPEEDDDIERIVSGNSGWAFKQREVDPHNSLTQNVRRILRKIPVVGENAKDDLGFQRYMDAEYVYATILNGCTWMIDADDFHTLVRDASGEIIENYAGKAIEELAKKYKWMETIQNYLDSDPDLISEFYSCFRMDYIPYYMLSTGKFVPVNREMSVANAYDAIVRNYEVGNKLSKDSIFDFSGKLNFDNAKEGSKIANSLQKALNNEEFGNSEYESLKAILNMLGVEADSTIEDFLELNTGNEDKDKMSYMSISKLISNARAIFDNLKELKEGEHLVNHFQNEYINIAKIVGSVTLFNRHMTFRQGEKDYPSYSTPNFATTTIKRLLSPDSTRRQQIFDFYKQSNWFFSNTGWKNFMLEQLESNNALVEELREGCLVNMNTMRVAVDRGQDTIFEETEAVPYQEWTPAMIKQSFVKAYFSAGHSTASTQQYGYYNFPIFADTTCAMFMKFLRFTDNYESEILPKLRQVVIQEFGRQKLVQERKGKAAEIGNFDKNGDKFFFFTELNGYMSDVSYDLMVSYYNGIIKKAQQDGNKGVIKLATDRIQALGARPQNGIVKALFKDVVKAHRSRNDVQSMNKTIDAAITEVMNRQFQEFMSNNIADNIPLIQSLVADGIIPQRELDTALQKLSEGKNLSASVTINREQIQTEGKPEEKTALYNSIEEALREYYWNNALMQTQIIEMMVVDPAFYKFDGGIDFQKRFKEVYASGRKLDTNSKYGRQFERAVYLKDRITTSRVFNTIKQTFDWAVQQGHITTRQRDEILDKYKEINNADAQAFRSPSSMRAVLDMAHVWTDQMEDAYNSILNGKWNPQNFSVIWQTLKPFMYTIIAKDDGVGGKILVPHQNKNSEFLLLAAYSMVAGVTAKNTKMSALCKFMENNGIDVIMYESAVKSGIQNPIDIDFSVAKLNEIEDTTWAQIEKAAQEALGKKFKEGRTKENFYEGTNVLLEKGTISQEEYNNLMDAVEPSEEEILKVLESACYTQNEQGQRVENLETIHVMPYADYMIATPTPEHWIDNKVVDGSQKRNLLPADLPDDPNFRVVVNGRAMTKQQVLDLYNALIIENLLEDFESVRNEVTNVHALQESLLQQIKGNPKYSKDFINVLTTKKVNGKEDFTIPLDFPSVRNKIAELILAKFKNKITKQKAKGGSCILVADTQNILNIVLEDGTYLDTKDQAAIAHAKAHNLIKGFECFLPAWTKDLYGRYLKTVTKNGETWQELDFDKLKAEAPELLEMSGIRIPTEDKYSMTPLIVRGFLPPQSGSAIMLPADITTIVGADFDVDKMFIRLHNFITDEEGRLKKVEYDYDSTPKAQTREQRENALLDIELGILRNKQVGEALFNPGSFDEIKRESRIAQILSDRANNGSSLLAIWQEEHGIEYSDIDKAIKSVNSASLGELKKFVERFSEKRSLLSPDTFIYNHQQNMAGAALIGMYANNTTGQAKMQTTRLAIKDQFTFNIEGRKIKSLHDMYSTKNGVTERISKRCAYFSAASVDNVKDPCLRKIGQNTQTASIAGFMLRAGLDVQEISLLFSQPFIKYCIDKSGEAPSAKAIQKHFKYLNDKYGTSVNPDGVLQMLQSHNFTVTELATNIIKASRYQYLDARDIANMDAKEKTEFVTNSMLALALFNRIANLSDQLRGSVQISRADSPNGAISNELHKANRQVQAVDEYMARESEQNWGLEYITDIMNNGVVSVSDSRDEMRNKLLSRDIRVPRLQAFYSLGIELASDLISKYFISQSPVCQAIVRKIETIFDKKLSDKQLKVLYNDFVTYILSGTERFGDDSNGRFDSKTMEERRDYYLYQYPQKFASVLRNNPKLAASPALNNMRVTGGEIIMERSGKITPTLRESIMQGFDSMLFGTDSDAQQVAYDLFMYSFYNEGFIFRHNSYGQFFSAAFLSSFEDIMDALRIIPDARMMENFYEQWASQDSIAPILAKIQPENSSVKENQDGTIEIEVNAGKINSRTGKWQHYISYKDNVYTLVEANESRILYVPANIIYAGPTSGKLHKFNANKSASEIAAVPVSKERVENLKKLNALSFRQQTTAERNAEGNIAEAAEVLAGIDEEQFANELYSQPKYIDDIEFISEFDFGNYRTDFLEFAEQIQQQYDEALGQKTLIDKGGKPLC